MSDEVIQMCGEHKDGRGYCQRALNHVGLHLFPPMPPHIYNQEEADALIAGAVLAVVPCPYCVGQVEMVDGEHVWRESKYVISNTRPCPRHDALAKMPDAARLALEEREKQIRLEVIRKVNLLLGMKADADLESFDKAKTALAEREAKLIADTLETAIAVGYKSISDTSPTDGLNHTLLTFVQRILDILPANIAAQAEERDRRVVYQFVQEILDKKRELYEIGSRESEAIQFVLNSLAHRAAVQPGG